MEGRKDGWTEGRKEGYRNGCSMATIVRIWTEGREFEGRKEGKIVKSRGSDVPEEARRKDGRKEGRIVKSGRGRMYRKEGWKDGRKSKDGL